MTDLIRETHKINARALELGLEPPVCLTWRASSDPGLDDEPCNIGRPAQTIDHLRMAAFTRMMHEVEDS